MAWKPVSHAGGKRQLRQRRKHQVKCGWRPRGGRAMRAESRLETEHNGHSTPLLQTTTPKRRERTKGNTLPQRRGRGEWD